MKILFLYFIELGLIFELDRANYLGQITNWYKSAFLSGKIAKALGKNNLQAALDKQEYLDAMVPMEDEMLDLTEGSGNFSTHYSSQFITSF